MCVLFHVDLYFWTCHAYLLASLLSNFLCDISNRCPVPTCKSARRKAKPLRPLPAKLQELPSDVKDRILSEMRQCQIFMSAITKASLTMPLLRLE